MKKSEKPVTEVSTSEPAVTSVTEEAIRERAYELYEQRGRLDGHALDDWLTAEAEIHQAARVLWELINEDWLRHCFESAPTD